MSPVLLPCQNRAELQPVPVPPRRLLHHVVGPDEAAAQGAAQAGRGDLQGQLPARGAAPPRLMDRGELLAEGALQRQ